MKKRPNRKGTMQINFRIPDGWPAEFEKLAVKLTAARGVPVSKTQAMREAMFAGWLELMDRP